MQIDATVVITAFDRKDSLIGLLERLNEQTFPLDSFEVIIADDSAEVNISRQVLNEVKTRYSVSTVKTILPYNVNGVSVARNMGIKMAKGDIIISIDDDCLPNRYFIEEHLSFHKKDYPLIVLGHRSESSDKLEESRPVSVTENKALSELISSASDELNFQSFMTGNISFPKRIALEAGLFNESFAQPEEHGWEDIEFGYRLWRKGFKTVFNRNALVYRPPLEAAKEEQRKAVSAYENARKRLMNIQPLIAYVSHCLQLTSQNKIEAALEIAEKIISQDGSIYGMLLLTGNLYLKLNKLDMAENSMRRAIEINSNNPVAYTKLGEILFKRKKWEESAAVITTALNIDPLRTQAIYYLLLLKHSPAKEKLETNLLGRKINVELGGGILPARIRSDNKDDFINIDDCELGTVDIVTNFNDKIPVPDNSISCIFSRKTLEPQYSENLSELISECFRILQKNCELFLCYPDTQDGVIGNCENSIKKDNITFLHLRDLLAKNGFRNISKEKGCPIHEEGRRSGEFHVRCEK